jgi:hypothetical protein
MNLTINNISFLKDLDINIKVDMRSGWRHHYIDASNLGEITSFIRLIGEDKIYLIIPLFCTSQSLSLPTLNLSEPFLVNNQSNSSLIVKFIIDQYKSSGFTIKQHTTIIFAFKFKRVWFSDK